jgi:hypothetical protein
MALTPAMSTPQYIQQRLQTMMRQTPGGSGNPGGPGGPEGPGGGPAPTAPAAPAAGNPPAANADDQLMGSLPQPFEGDRKLAWTFLDQLTGYFRANSLVPGLNLPIHKVSIALTLFHGQQVAAWV